MFTSNISKKYVTINELYKHAVLGKNVLAFRLFFQVYKREVSIVSTNYLDASFSSFIVHLEIQTTVLYAFHSFLYEVFSVLLKVNDNLTKQYGSAKELKKDQEVNFIE